MRISLLFSCLALMACDVEPESTHATVDTLKQGCGSYGDFPVEIFAAQTQLHQPDLRQVVETPTASLWLSAGLVAEDRPSAAMEAAHELLAECVPIDGGWGRAEDADLRLTELMVDGVVAAGETVTVQIGMAEVSGRGHMEYPAATLKVDVPGAVVTGEGRLIRYGLFGCQEAVSAVEVTFPADLAPGTVVRFTALTGFGFCDNAPACTQTDAAVAERIAHR